MPGPTPLARRQSSLLTLLGVLVVCATWALPARAQSVTPASANLEAPNVGESASVTFVIEDFDGFANFESPDVTLCLSSCATAGDAQRTVGGMLPDSGSSWTLGDVSCGELSQTFLCEVSVTYVPGDRRSRSAELLVEDGFTLTNLRPRSSALAEVAVPLTGSVAPQPLVGTPEFGQDEYRVREGESVDVVVRRTGGSDGRLEATWYVLEDDGSSSGAPASPADYRLTPASGGVLTWEDGDTGPRPITVEARVDRLPEQTESLTLVVEIEGEGSGGSPSDFADVLILDVAPEEPGVARFEQATYRVDEGGSVDILVRREGGSDGPLSVDWSVAAGGTAVAADYRLGGGEDRVLRWAADDATPRRITVAATVDDLLEGPETFSIVLDREDGDGGEGSDEGDRERTRITIVDTTPVPEPGVVQFARAAYTVEEDDGPVALIVTRTDGSDGAVAVNYRLADGTATFGEDYGDRAEGVDGRVAWVDGETGAKTILVAVNEDLEREGADETFTATLSLPPAAPDGGAPRATLGARTETTVSIVDTTAPPDTVALARAAYTLEEGDGTLDVVVRRLGGGLGAASVGYRVSAGTASAGSDFATDAASGRISWAAGETDDRVVSIRIVDDALPEPDETFTVALAEPVNATLGRPASAEVTVTDDGRAGVLDFDPTRYAVAEDDGSVTLSVSRSDGSEGAATVTWTAADRSARAGEDYARAANAARSGTLRWDAGDSADRTITLDIAGDGVVEPEENFVVTLSAPTGAALGTDVVANVLIADVTVITRDRLRFAEAASEVNERDGAARLVVQRVGTGDGAASVRYTLSADSISVLADLAPGTPTEGVLAWRDGDTSDRVLAVALADDTLVEEDERFTVTLSSPSGAELGSPTSNEVTVIDDDVPDVPVTGTVAFVADALAIEERDGSVDVLIERVGGTDGAWSVRYDTVDAGAVAGEDYTAASGTLDWDDGEAGTRTVTIDVGTDARVESDERFIVQLADATASGEPLPLEASEITVTIVDTTDVGTLVALDTAPSALESDGEAVVRIARTGGADGPLRVSWGTFAETAVAGEDFIAGSGTLAWADGESGPREVRVPILDDTIEEPDETFLVRFSDVPIAAARTLAVGDVQVTIVDDDRGNPGVIALEPLTALGPRRLRIVSGDEQSGQPGDILEPLLADVVDESANDARLAEVPVRWRVNPAGSAELLEGERGVSDTNGRVGNRVRVLSRGFVNIVAVIDVAGAGDGPDAPPAASPAVATPGEAVFVVRAGLRVAGGLTGGQSATGGALDIACDALGARIESGVVADAGELDLFATCGELDARLTDGRLPAALARLAPEELFAIADSVVDTTDIQVTNVYARINAIRGERRRALDLAGFDIDLYGERVPGGVVDAAKDAWTGGGAAADEDGPGSRLGVFVNGTVSVGEVDSDGNQQDADIRTRGVTIGADYRVTANAVAGVGLGVVVNETEFVGDGGSADMDGINLTVFGTWYEPDSGYLDGVLDIGRNRYDVRRRINLPGLPDRFGVGETDADVLSLTFSAGKDIAFGAWEIGPYTRLSHIRATVGGYSERADGDGAGLGSVLDIQGHDVRSTRIALGGQVSRTIGTRRGVVVPQLRVETELENEKRKDGIVASFQHDPSRTPFTIEGDEYDNGYVNIGLGGSGVFAGGRSGYLFYETRLAHEYITQHWIKAGFRLEF